MKQNNKRFSSLLLALAFIVIALVAFFDFLEPAYGDLQALKGKELSQQNFLSNERQIVDQVKGLIGAYTTQAQGQQSLSLSLPVGQNVAGALAQIFGLASANGVVVQNTSISIQAIQAQAANAAAPASGQIAAASASGGSIVKPLGSITLQFTALGSYENFKVFLKGLESNVRIFDMKSISIHPVVVPGGKPGASQDLFQYDITVVTYYQAS